MAKNTFNIDKYHKVFSIVWACNQTGHELPTYAELARKYEISAEEAKMYSLIAQNKDYLNLSTDEDLRDALIMKSKQLQSCRDTSRLLRKDVREHDRVPNAIQEANKAQLDILRKYQYHDPISVSSKADRINLLGDPLTGVGIIQISDAHFNEQVALDGINIFNFERASKMLRKLVTTAIIDFKHAGFRKVLVACTGDLLNSDRRIDELLQNATNRTKAKFIVVDLLQQVLKDLSNEFDDVYFAGVTGNESRVGQDLGWSEIMATDNYDYDIYKTLAFLFAGHPKVHVLEQDNYMEYPVAVCGQWILLTHGTQRTLQGDVEKGVIQMCGKWADSGYMISFILFGHLHYTRIGDHFARSGSFVGANAYSNRALQLITKSSQLLHFIYGNGDIFNKRIDLTNVDNVVPYLYNKDLESYNSKSKLKTREGRTILEIKI